MTNGFLVEARKVSVFFPSRRRNERGCWALKNINLILRKGESLALIGESGSGKTTLLRILLGLISPTEGASFLFGGNIHRCSRQERIGLRRRCGYVSQDPYGSLPPTLTVIDAVAEPWIIVYGRKSRSEAYGRARNILEKLGIREDRLLSARVRSGLSGGQRQRIALARALILEPELLLCDEPTSMQDASTRSDIVDLLCERVTYGMSMIFVTHDLYLARAAAEKGMILLRGECCEEGATQKLLSFPKHRYTRRLIDATPTLTDVSASSL